MGELEILHELIQLFREFKLQYLLTGGYAVTYYGEPRATNDIDFLIEITNTNKNALLQILDRLDSTYIVDKQQITSVKTERTEFNIVHEAIGIKIDFWLLPNKDFTSEYKRSKTVKIGGKQVVLTSPEDLILTKLKWCKEVFSERHFRDCVGILQIQGDKIDYVYLKEQAKKLQVTELLRDIIEYTHK